MSETLTMYELGYHLDPALDEAAAAQNRTAVEKLATDKGATIVISKEPERTRLSYPINHQRASYFGYFRFTLENKDGLAEIDEELKLNPAVIRSVLLKIEPESEKRAPRVRPTMEKKATPATPAQPNAVLDEQIENVLGNI